MTKPPSKRPAMFLRAARPTGTPAQRLASVLHLRPDRVPEHATLVAAWVDLPGENEQRTGHWRRNTEWKKQLLADFSETLAAQVHPGVLERPNVHVRLDVRGLGDATNRFSRAKHPLDLLQELKVDRNGKRHQGALSLIHNDSQLGLHNTVIEEFRAERRETGALTPRSGKRIVDADLRVLIWIWEDR